jgi:hypothetical protein
MSDRESRFLEWQAPLQELILELDREKLTQKVLAVEALVFERLQRPFEGSEGRSEREALRDALSVLRAIKRDRLGFPDWK